MDVVNSDICHSVQEVERLRKLASKRCGTFCTIKLDVHLIRPSQYAARLESTYCTIEFVRLVDSIAAEGANIEAVILRPLRKFVGSSNKFEKNPVVAYEVVIGSLRVEACRQAGAPVLATIQPLNDRDSLRMQLASGRCCKLSPYEMGLVYRHALELKVFRNQQAIADATRVDKSMVSEGVRLGRLPLKVVKAFFDPAGIQYEFAKPLVDALHIGREVVEQRAEEIRRRPDYGSIKPKDVLNMLLGRVAELTDEAIVRVMIGKVTVAKVEFDAAGQPRVVCGKLNADERGVWELLRRLLQLPDPDMDDVVNT